MCDERPPRGLSMASDSTTRTILYLLAVANCILANVIVQRPTLVTYHNQPGYPQPVPGAPGQRPVFVHGYPPGAGPPVYQPGQPQPPVYHPGQPQPPVYHPGQPQPPVVLVPVGPGYPGGFYPPPQGGDPFDPNPDGPGGHHGPPFIEEVIPVLKNVPSVDEEEDKKKRPRKGTNNCRDVDNKKGIPAPPTDLATSESRKSKKHHEEEGVRKHTTKRPRRVNPKNERLVKGG